MEHHEWVNAAYRCTAKAIEECYNNSSIDGWSENYITTRVLESIAKLGLELDWQNKPIKAKWEGLKLKGNAENEYGDIAILVRVWLTSDRFVEGVAFYEAKRQYFKENNEALGFTSIKSEQLVKLESKSHASNILLYDVDVVRENALASSVPTLFVLQLEKSNLARSTCRLLHSYGEPWVVSLGKNLLGLNLDFRKEAVDIIKNISLSKRKPAFILNASVGMATLEATLNDTLNELGYYENWLNSNPQKPSTKVDPTSDDEDPDFRPK